MGAIAILGILALVAGLVLLLAGVITLIIAASKNSPAKQGLYLLLWGAVSLLCSFSLCSMSFNS